MKLEFRRAAVKFIDGLDAKQYRQVMRCILGLLIQPVPHDSQLLAGGNGLRRVTSGEFRVVYGMDDTIQVHVVGRRNDDSVYRQLRDTMG